MGKSSLSILDQASARNARALPEEKLFELADALKPGERKAVRSFLGKVALVVDDPMLVDELLDRAKEKSGAKIGSLRQQLDGLRVATATAAYQEHAEKQRFIGENAAYSISPEFGRLIEIKQHGRIFYARAAGPGEAPVALCTRFLIVSGVMFLDRESRRAVLIEYENEQGERERVLIPAEAIPKSADLISLMRGRGMLFDGQDGSSFFLRVMGLSQPVPSVVRDRTGWLTTTAGAAYFQAPSGAIWGADPEEYSLSDTVRAGGEPTGGTFEGWREGARAISRSTSNTLKVALLTGWVGMLLGLAQRGTLVVCFSDPTSSGKSWRQKIGVAVTGNPRPGVGQMQSMNSTEIALEIPLARGSSSICAFDELQFAAAKTVQKIIFVASGEQGRNRSNREGGAGLRHAWTGGCVTLSSEIPLAQKLRAEGEVQTGGLNVRVLEVSGSGPEEHVHDDDYREADKARTNYGHAWAPFLNEVKRRGWVDDPSHLDQRISDIVAMMPGADDPASRRSAAGVAFLQAAGEVAEAAGLIDSDFNVPAVAAALWDEAQAGGSAAADPVDAAIDTLIENINARRGTEVVDVDRFGANASVDAHREIGAWVDELDGERVYVVRASVLARWSGNAADERALKAALLDREIAIRSRRARRPGAVWDEWRRPVGRVSCVVLRASEVEGEVA